MNLQNRSIFCRDNLDILQGINSNCIDLIYLDPPFNKKKTFTAPIGSSAEGASFKDIFKKEDIKDEWIQTIKEDKENIYHLLHAVKNIESNTSYNFCYLAYMAIRLLECHRILKDTGSIYLHCDPTMSHYLKLLLDCIFGEKQFRNEIVWSYDIGGRGDREFAKKHDIILCLAKDINKYKFYGDKIRIPYKTQVKGRKKPLISPERYKKGKIPTNVWGDIHVNLVMKERTDYPTQKPLKLLERIIKASSNEDDVVLDPFCGCATTCVAAEKLGRKWIGIDVSIEAYRLVQERLKTEVANPEDMFQYKNKIHFSVSPPKRTDQEEDHREKKYVYVISHEHYPGEYKVGIAKNCESRLNSYQTSDPNRSYKLEYKIHTHLFREIERHIHATFENKHEWVREELKNIIREIENYTVTLLN